MQEEAITFKMMSYNILAEKEFDKRADHLLPDSICRSSIYRRNRILAELE